MKKFFNKYELLKFLLCVCIVEPDRIKEMLLEADRNLNPDSHLREKYGFSNEALKIYRSKKELWLYKTPTLFIVLAAVHIGFPLRLWRKFRGADFLLSCKANKILRNEL